MPEADKTLDDIIYQEHLSTQEFTIVRGVARQLGDCLAFMHSRGVVHGDFKPRNVVRMQTDYSLIDLDLAMTFDATSAESAPPTGVDGAVAPSP